ncbi:hypothetical protein BD408DRAFT_423004 [Parasitella parasitica]|nr:hypothetical protein BD408DRAFT_423004 [Parasitella parasitica]
MRRYQLTTLHKCKPLNANILLNVNAILNGYVKDNLSDDIARIQLLQHCQELKEEKCCVIQVYYWVNSLFIWLQHETSSREPSIAQSHGG